MGIVRPPIFMMGDGFRGLPAFLSNNYAGNARQELLIGLEHFNILTRAEITKAVDAWTEFRRKNPESSGITNVSSWCLLDTEE